MLVAELTRWQQLFFQTARTAPHSPGRKGDTPRPDFMFLWHIVSWRESQDFILFLMFLKVRSPPGPEMAPWCGGAPGSSSCTPALWDQGIPVAFEPRHRLGMLMQCLHTA